MRRGFQFALTAAMGFLLGVAGSFLFIHLTTESYAVLRCTVTLTNATFGEDQGVTCDVNIMSPRRGFVSIVTFDNKGASVYPGDWSSERLVIPKKESVIQGYRMSPNQDVLVVITETPASNTIRKGLSQATQSEIRESSLEVLIRDILQTNGYRWVAMSDVVKP